MKKTALITHVNTGIGLLTAMDLARAGVTVCMACNNSEQAEASRNKILQVVPTAKIELYTLDLSSFTSIRQMVKEFSAKHQYLDVLINNTDTGCIQQEVTQEGFEPQFGIHYLGPFLLTHLLLPLLEATVALKGEARILHAASMTHLVGKLNENSFSGQLPYRPVAAYAQSKLASLMFNFTLARRLPAGITTHAFHLDGGDACIWRKLPRLVYAFLRLFLTGTERVGILAVDLALGSSYKGATGGYHSVQWPKAISRLARDQQKQDWLYQKSCELTGVTALG